MGPIDYLIMEFPKKREPGSALPLLLDLVDRGVARILDLVIIRRELDDSVVRVNLADLSPVLAVFDGASSGLLDQHDIENAAAAIDRDSAAALIAYKNRSHGRSDSTWASCTARAQRDQHTPPAEYEAWHCQSEPAQAA
jgi:hypothetical protein